MAGALTLIHTADVHCDSFNALRDQIAPGVTINHLVRSDWLAVAQGGITPFLAKEISDAVAEVDGTVICTCTTIGPVAESAGAIRIDRPMMHAAAKAEGPVMMAYCLDSTRAPSLALLQSEMEKAGNTAPVLPLSLCHLWPLFEARQTDAFAAGVALAIRAALTDHAAEGVEPGAVVLAQASMAGAGALLTDLPCAVLSSPELALKAGLAGR